MRWASPSFRSTPTGRLPFDAQMVNAAPATSVSGQIDLLLDRECRQPCLHGGLRLGEHRRIVLLSVPEGDDKIAKYPAIFRGSHALAITKIDLLPHFDFSVDRVVADMSAERRKPAFSSFQQRARRCGGDRRSAPGRSGGSVELQIAAGSPTAPFECGDSSPLSPFLSPPGDQFRLRTA